MKIALKRNTPAHIIHMQCYYIFISLWYNKVNNIFKQPLKVSGPISRSPVDRSFWWKLLLLQCVWPTFYLWWIGLYVTKMLPQEITQWTRKFPHREKVFWMEAETRIEHYCANAITECLRLFGLFLTSHRVYLCILCTTKALGKEISTNVTYSFYSV